MLGLSKEQVQDKIKFIESYVNAANAASGSEVDANANVTHKNIATLTTELFKNYAIQVNRGLVVNHISKRFGPELAQQYINDLKSHVIYTNDESSLNPYCCSISLYPFLVDGMTKLGGESKAPEHLESFVGSFANLIFAVSSQVAGAVATVEWLAYLAYFARKDYGDQWFETKCNGKLDQCFQAVVYTLNQPAAARGYQSVFWNISLFDQHFFEGLFGNFYFPDGSQMLWKDVDRIQRYFMLWFREERKKALLTFPVVTLSALSDEAEGVWKDSSYQLWASEEYAAGSEFFIYTSPSVDSLSSCCFTPDTLVNVQINGVVTTGISFEDLYAQVGDSEIDVYVNRDEGYHKPGRVVRVEIPAGSKLITFHNKLAPPFTVTADHQFMTKAGLKYARDITVEDVFEVGVNLPAYRTDAPYPGVWIDSITEQITSTPGFVYCFEMTDTKDPYFSIPCGVISHNCRLRNPLVNNEFSYSLGAGGIMTGSKNVITINVNRCVQTMQSIPELLSRVHQYQVAFNDLYNWYADHGMLQIVDAGFVDLSKLYLTVGLNGVLEAAEFLGMTPDNNDEYRAWVKDLFQSIKSSNKAASIAYGVRFNTELVPAENLGVKNAKWDRKDKLAVPRDCYNSYLYRVEDESIDLWDKLMLHGGDILENLDGGSAVHFNNNERLTAAQYHAIFSALVRTGSNYFCENVLKSCCTNDACGYIHPNRTDKCPKCGAPVEYATRVIGYLKRIKSFSADRQAEAASRHYHA